MKIGYVCTNYNNSSFTISAVESLMRIPDHDIIVVAVDNASVEDEVVKLRPLIDRFSSFHLIESEQNVGYFRGLNLGLKMLRNRWPDVDWVIAGNNDLEFPIEFCDEVERHMDTLGLHLVVSPDVVTLDGEHQNPHVISKIGTAREIVYDLYYSNFYLGLLIAKLAKMFPRISERKDEQEWQIARPIYQGHGSCYLLTPKFFENFDEFWAPTFMMAEELFLSKQLSDIGEQVYYDPCIRVVHHWHGSLEKVPGRSRWEMARKAHREYRKHVRILGGSEKLQSPEQRNDPGQDL